MNKEGNTSKKENGNLDFQDSHKKAFPFGIYVHWPFCLSKCPYCDFFSRVKKDINQDELISKYLDDLTYYAQTIGNRNVSSVFFGGGTPSLISPQNIEKIIEHIAKLITLSDNAEISLEKNPNTQKPNIFSDLKKSGINRLSLGVQSLDDNELKFLGRTHSANQALQALEEICSLFDNTSADLIYALPDQNADLWQQNLERLLKFPLKHLSLYQLTIEENTAFAKKKISPLADDEAASFYSLANQIASAKGYQQYEVSNYAQKGFACRHNLLYWQGDDYLGIGQGAHGRLSLSSGIYAQSFPRLLEKLTPQERAEELVIMGLRLTSGINKKHFYDCCQIKFDDFINQKHLAELKQQNLLQEDSQNLKATQQGFLVLNYLIEKLCS